MNFFCILCVSLFISAIAVSTAYAQEIPNDPNHLPQMIGSRNLGNSRIDRVRVSGKITIDGLSPSQSRPALSVSVYTNGRFVQRIQVRENGTFSIDGVPRLGSFLSVEVNNTEVANEQILTTVGDTVYQNITVNWQQIEGKIARAEVISAKNLYQRTEENQKLFDKAVSAAKDKNNKNAVSLFKQILANDPKDFVSWFQIGNLYFLDEKAEDAEAAYNKALEQKPDYVPALTNLGRLYLSQNNSEKAVSVLTKAVESDPLSADAQHYLGEAYLQAKKGSKAVGHLNEAIRLAPTEKAEIHLRLAALYNAAGLKDRAALEYQKFIEKVPKHPERKKLEEYIKTNLPSK